MPIYEYYCATCNAEFEALRPVSKADEPTPCKTCGQPGEASAIHLLLQVQYLHRAEAQTGYQTFAVLQPGDVFRTV